MEFHSQGLVEFCNQGPQGLVEFFILILGQSQGSVGCHVRVKMFLLASFTLQYSHNSVLSIHLEAILGITKYQNIRTKNGQGTKETPRNGCRKQLLPSFLSGVIINKKTNTCSDLLDINIGLYFGLFGYLSRCARFLRSSKK